MSRIILCLLFTVLGACSIIEPFVDRRREAGQTGDSLYVGSSKVDAPAICYNSLATDFETIQQMADEECRKHDTGTGAMLDEKKGLSCRVFTPTIAKFQCVR